MTVILPFLLIRYTPTRRHLGDRLAGTVAVNSAPPLKKRHWILVGAICVTGALALYAFLMQGPRLLALREFVW